VFIWYIGGKEVGFSTPPCLRG